MSRVLQFPGLSSIPPRFFSRHCRNYIIPHTSLTPSATSTFLFIIADKARARGKDVKSIGVVTERLGKSTKDGRQEVRGGETNKRGKWGCDSMESVFFGSRIMRSSYQFRMYDV